MERSYLSKEVDPRCRHALGVLFVWEHVFLLVLGTILVLYKTALPHNKRERCGGIYVHPKLHTDGSLFCGFEQRCFSPFEK